MMRHAVTGRRGRGAPFIAILIVAASGAGGCEPYRIEYHKRPAFYHSASVTPLPDRIEMPDGRVIVYETEQPRQNYGTSARKASAGDGAEGSVAEEPGMLEIREERTDGSVVIRCILPEHIVGNLMTCLRFEEYGVIWDQLLSRRTRQSYEARGAGFEAFAEEMQTQRRELMTMLNRMSFSFYGSDVVLEGNGQGGLRARLSPFIADQFKFTTIEMVNEDGLMKLLMIR